MAVRTPKQVADAWASATAAKGEPLFPLALDAHDAWREAYIESCKRMYVQGEIDVAGLEQRLDDAWRD